MPWCPLSLRLSLLQHQQQGRVWSASQDEGDSSCQGLPGLARQGWVGLGHGPVRGAVRGKAVEAGARP